MGDFGDVFPKRNTKHIQVLLGTWHPGIPHPYTQHSSTQHPSSQRMLSCLRLGSPRSKLSSGLQQLGKGMLGLAGELLAVVH